MKKYTHFIYSLLFLLTTLIACDREKIDYGLDDKDGFEEGIGKLNLSFPLQTKASGNFDDFVIKIFNAAGEPEKEYIYGQMPDMIELNAGSYTVQAESPGFDSTQPSDKPYYKGAENFTIKKDEITIINTIVCNMQNIKVEMLLAESLESVLASYEVTATFIGDGGQTMNFSYDQNYTGDPYIYFPEINEGEQHVLTVQLSGVTNAENGSKDINLGRTYADVKAGEYRRITFTYTANGGSTNINLGIDAECEIVDKNIVVPGIPTDPEPGDDEIEIIGFMFGDREFDLSETLSLPSGSEENVTLIVRILAPSLIKDLKVKIVSEILSDDVLYAAGLRREFSLAYPADLEEILSEMLEFPTGNEVINQYKLDFNVTNFTSLLTQLGDGEHSFVITVTDQAGISKFASLNLKVE